MNRNPVTPAQRHAAEMMDRDRTALDRIANATVGKLGMMIRLRVLRAFRRGEDPSAPLLGVLESARQPLIDAMVSAHLKGRVRQAMTTAPQLKEQRKLVASRVTFDSAIEFLARRLDITEFDVLQLNATYIYEADLVLDAMRTTVDQRIGQTLADITTQGMGVTQGVRELQIVLASMGFSPDNRYALENLFRTQTQVAYSAGRWNSLAAPEVQDVLWGFRYVTVGDDRVRPGHAAMDGITLPKDDPWWSTNWPPNGYSCRCGTVEIFKGTPQGRSARPRRPERVTIDGVGVDPVPDKGWSFNPGLVFRDHLAP